MRASSVWVVCACLSALVACGGRVYGSDGGTTGTDNGPSSSGSDGDSGDDAAPGQMFGVCPPSPPTVGAACSMPGEGCAYIEQIGALTQSCQAFACDAAQHWQPASSGC